ncbi:hypothetical protein [Streptomyces uncialis]|uniref:hypothetical protein n=1 Tax=Streptomyces uncialis TaxID=1048205 RepID=UPI0033CF238F
MAAERGGEPEEAGMAFRETSQDVPRTSGGLPVHVTSVLVADEHCYEHRHRDRL